MTDATESARRRGAGPQRRRTSGLHWLAMIRTDSQPPDIETASEDYARRFGGEAGQFFLDVQTKAVGRLLGPRSGQILRVLEVGGGHGQLTSFLLACGFDVWVQGSTAECSERLRPLLRQCRGRLHFVASPLAQMPFPDDAFDLVIGIRLLAHVGAWRTLLQEMARVSRRRLLVDYAPLASANALTPLLYTFKQRIEGNTRPYFCHATGSLARALQDFGFVKVTVEKQFFLPMALHRWVANRRFSETLEAICRRLGLTAAWGSPGLLLADKQPSPIAGEAGGDAGLGRNVA